VRLRGGGSDGPPAALLAYRAEGWPDPGEWSRARRAWLRRHARTLEDVHGLFGPDVVFPPETDPRVERRLALALQPARQLYDDDEGR
jgi:hypothetical protein